MHIKQALFHNTAWKILTMLFTFVNNIIIVRLLGTEASASFFYAIAAFTLVSTVLRFGLENAVIYYTSKYPGQTGPLALFILIVTAVQAVISFAILYYFIREANAYSLFWCGAFVVSNVLIYYVTAFYQVKRMYISINVSAAFIALLQTTILLIFYFSKINFLLHSGFAKNINDAVLMVLTAGILLQLLFLVLWFYRSNRPGLIGGLPGKGMVKNILGYSIVNFAATVLLFLIMRADFYFVEKYCNSVILANYVQVAKVGQMALVFPSLLGGVIFPYTVNASESFSEKISFFCRVLTLLFIILSAVFVVAGRFIFTRMFGPDFNLVYSGLCCTLFGVYCLAINMVLASYFEGKNSQNIILLSNAATLSVILTGDYFFVPLHGFLAAAIVFSAANFMGMAILLVRFLKKTSISYADIFLFGRRDGFIFKFWK